MNEVSEVNLLVCSYLSCNTMQTKVAFFSCGFLWEMRTRNGKDAKSSRATGKQQQRSPVRPGSLYCCLCVAKHFLIARSIGMCRDALSHFSCFVVLHKHTRMQLNQCVWYDRKTLQNFC